MKKYHFVFLLLLLLVGKTNFAQTNLYIKNSITDDIIYNGLQIDNYYYYLMSSGTFSLDTDIRESEVKGYNNYLLKFDESLNVVDSVHFDSISGFYINFYFMIEYNDTLLLVGNELKADLSECQIIVEKYLLPSLTYVDRQLYGDPDVFETINDILINQKGNIIALANNITNINRNPIIMEINKNGDLLKYLNDTTLNVAWGNIYQMPSTLDYILNSGLKTIVFDSTLSNHYSFLNPNPFFQYCSRKCYYNDSTYIIGGNRFTGIPDVELWVINYYVVNDGLENIDSGFIYISDTIDKIGGMGFINPSTVIYGGTHNRNWDQYWIPEMFQEEPRWVVLKSEDIITKNENWFFIYGGVANYTMRDLVITENNSCIVSCTKYDWQSTDELQRDVLIFEVDTNGVLVSTNQNIEIPYVTVYPNPGNNLISIRNTIVNGHIIINDISGKTVFEKELSNSIESIDVSFLNSGFYIISFYEGNKFLFSHKWVKKL